MFYDRSKGLCVSYMSVPVRLPSNGAYVRQMQIIVSATSSILWGAKMRWVLTLRGHLSRNISGVPRPISKLNGQSKGLCVSYMSVLVRMPSNGACVRQMQIIASVTSYILRDPAWSHADRILIWIYLVSTYSVHSCGPQNNIICWAVRSSESSLTSELAWAVHGIMYSQVGT